MNDPSAIAADVEAALAKETGCAVAVSDFRRLTAGATKATWAFSAAIDGEAERLILQVSGPALSARASTGPADP